MRLKKLGAALVVVVALGAVLASNAFAAAATEAKEWNVGGSMLTGKSETVSSTAVGTATFETEVGSTKYVLTATGIDCVGCTIANTGSPSSATGTGHLKFTGVSVMEPAGCSVASEIETTELTVSADWMEGEKVYVKFTPAAGETKEFATVAITGCALATTIVPKGTVFVEAANKTEKYEVEQEVHSSKTINEVAGGSLKVGTKNAVLTGRAKLKLNSGAGFGVL
jgi:hypothetical protein